MFLRNAILTVFLMVPVATYAGVTIYDKNAGHDVPAEERDGKLQRLPTLKIEQAPRQGSYITPDIPQIVQPAPAPRKDRGKAFIARTNSPSDIELLPWETENYNLGHAQIFVEGKHFSKDLAKNIMKLRNIEGLRVSLYMKPAETMGELRTFFGNGFLKMAPGLDFSSDSSNRHFKSLGLTEYMTVHYTSPFGDARAFPLNNPQYVLNKIDYVRTKLRSQQ
jgi:hypothetical protein